MWIRLRFFVISTSFRENSQDAHDGTFFHRPAKVAHLEKSLAVASTIELLFCRLEAISMKPANRLHLNYALESRSFQPISGGIIDIHSHIHGDTATRIYSRAARHYGIVRTYSMTQLTEIPRVERILGDRVRFIAIPNFSSKDRSQAFGRGFIEDLKVFYSHGARIAKFWNAPRIYEATSGPFVSNPLRLNSQMRKEAMRAAADLGMIFMVHIGDPDTWFQTKYADTNRYGTKLQQYETLEEVLDLFPNPWIAAHMGGYPEDLRFLSKLLLRHKNLYLDCSATKWIVRELSKHPPVEVRQFFETWKGRILFGSDIVTSDAHVSAEQSASEIEAKATTSEEAYDLYASRYWALRTLFERDYEGESPISDPDLHLVEPQRHTPFDAPTIRGASLSKESLRHLYWRAATDLGL
jgi:hypothetical protein